MKQVNQIGKYTKKQDVLEAKKGRTFVTPKNREYVFDYERVSINKYHFIICYMGQRWRMSETDYTRNNIDDILKSIEKHISEVESGKFAK